MSEEAPDITFNELGLARGFNEGAVSDFPALILEMGRKFGHLQRIHGSGRSELLCWDLEVLFSLCQGQQPR